MQVTKMKTISPVRLGIEIKLKCYIEIFIPLLKKKKRKEKKRKEKIKKENK